MKIVIVGSGTGVPLPDRGSPSILLMVGGEYTLFDLGPGSLRQLLRIGVPHERIDRIFFTHFHPDHTADLVVKNWSNSPCTPTSLSLNAPSRIKTGATNTSLLLWQDVLPRGHRQGSCCWFIFILRCWAPISPANAELNMTASSSSGGICCSWRWGADHSRKTVLPVETLRRGENTCF
jgi:ribonuclease BN (tRNA processing enzyme)